MCIYIAFYGKVSTHGYIFSEKHSISSALQYQVGKKVIAFSFAAMPVTSLSRTFGDSIEDSKNSEKDVKGEYMLEEKINFFPFQLLIL